MVEARLDESRVSDPGVNGDRLEAMTVPTAPVPTRRRGVGLAALCAVGVVVTGLALAMTTTAGRAFVSGADATVGAEKGAARDATATKLPFRPPVAAATATKVPFHPPTAVPSTAGAVTTTGVEPTPGVAAPAQVPAPAASTPTPTKLPFRAPVAAPTATKVPFRPPTADPTATKLPFDPSRLTGLPTPTATKLPFSPPIAAP